MRERRHPDYFRGRASASVRRQRINISTEKRVRPEDSEAGCRSSLEKLAR